MRVLDAGCGGGRNLVYLLREGFDVWGTDGDAAAVASVRDLAARLAPSLPPDRFRVEPVEALSFADQSMDAVISSAVLHFARDDAHFHAMIQQMWRVLAPGGDVLLPAGVEHRHGRPDARRSATAGSACPTAACATWWTRRG